MIDVITSGKGPGCLEYLLDFLAAWEKRPVELTQMAYQWCSAISEEAGRLGFRERPISQLDPQGQRGYPHNQCFFRRGQWDPHPLDGGFSEVGPKCDQIHSGGTSYHIWWGSLGDDETLYLILEIAFRLAALNCTQPHLHFSHTQHCNWVFEIAFSSGNDDIVADAVCAWIVDHHHVPTSSFVHYLAKYVESGMPFSQRLRQLSIRAIEQIWPRELEVSELETVHLLNHLKVDVNDFAAGSRSGVGTWARLLLSVIYLPSGQEKLSPHYWHLLDTLHSGTVKHLHIEGRSTPHSAITKSLEKSEDWDKLEIWMLVTWHHLQDEDPIEEGIEQTTLRLLSQRPSALLRFEHLSENRWLGKEEELQQICRQVRMEQSSSGSLPPYVSVYPTQHLFVLINFCCFVASVERIISSYHFGGTLWFLLQADGPRVTS